ncbi:hypothetical protein D3C86_1513230 [compost metagenome]
MFRSAHEARFIAAGFGMHSAALALVTGRQIVTQRIGQCSHVVRQGFDDNVNLNVGDLPVMNLFIELFNDSPLDIGECTYVSAIR